MQAHNLLSIKEYEILCESLTSMLRALEVMIDTSLDDAAGEPIPIVHQAEPGLPGHACIEIDKNWLAYASQGMTCTDIVKVMQCHPQTVRQHQLEHGLAEPAPPVIQTVV
ncbi:hypothetical protein APHAL10511_002860 [Amanita phalloides]|nr:hypothetical protein APHAL10511_002860 [Amanita phalloides]